jgi:hypothetical protein
VITAGITAAIAAILGVFGIKPGPYLVLVAGGVKLTIVVVGLVFGARWARRRAQKKAAETGGPPPAG